jgi:hypothetical protein
MSIETLTQRIIDQMSIAHQAGRLHQAPAEWDVDNEAANAKPLAECIARAVIPEITITQTIDIPMLAVGEFPSAIAGVIRLFADLQGRVLKRYPDGTIEEIVSTEYRP